MLNLLEYSFAIARNCIACQTRMTTEVATVPVFAGAPGRIRTCATASGGRAVQR
jgi:hypothetical protein